MARSWALALGLLALCAAATAASETSGDSDVVALTDATLAAALKENGETGVLLEFYAPWCGHCKKLAPTYEKVATALKGMVTVAKVDATQNQDAASQFDVKGYPTVLLAKGGKKYKFQGKRTVEELVVFAKEGDKQGEGEAIGNGAEPEYDGPDHVIPLTDSNFEHQTQASTGATTGDWLVMFYAPWCGHCKKLHPTFKAAAAELKEQQVNVASVDATENMQTARRFDVRGYPTVKMLSQGKEYSYKGKRTKDDLVAWATGGFKDGEASDVRPAPNAWEALVEEVVAQWKVMKKDLSTLLQYKKNALIVTFAAGAVAGILLAFGMFACLGGLSPPPVVVSTAEQATPASGGAGAGAGSGAAKPTAKPNKPKQQ